LEQELDMIKPIMSNNIGRKFLATAMFATAVTSANAANLYPEETAARTDTTEQVIPRTFDIIKIHTYHLGTYSFDKNKKLDKTYLKNCNSETKRTVKKENLKSLYENLGTYGATLEIQQMIDEHFLQESYKKYFDHFTLTNKDREKFNNVISNFEKWKNEVFYKDFQETKAKMYRKKEFPSAELAIETIDNYVSKANLISKDDLLAYKKNSERFQTMQKEKETALAKSDLLAYKVHLLNALVFKKYFFEINKSYDSYLYSFYFQEFINSEASIKP
jgi:hypothetical protein